MSISAKLFVDDQEYNILEYNLKFYQETDGNNKPIGNFKGGHFNIKVETIKNSLLLEWMFNSDSMKKVKIVFPSRTGISKSRTIELLDTYCIANNKAFSATNPEPLTTNITLSPASMIENGEVMFSKSWRVTDPTPRERKPAEDKDEEKKLILSFTAKRADLDDGKFGFDKFNEDFKKIYTGKDFTTFENEYNPMQVYGEKYFPVWVSMRKGQTITLDLEQIKLGKVKTKNYDLYEEIKFADHPDFTFAPSNLKDAKEVHITCNASNPATAQIKLEADDETVGAINFFYPEPKKVDLRWVRVNFKDEDLKATKKIIENDKILENYFKTGFNPALLDINVVNNEAEILDLNKKITDEGEIRYVKNIKNRLKVGTDNSAKSEESERLRLITSLNSLHLKRQKRESCNGEVYLYLTNLKCEIPAINSDDELGLNNGITIENLSLMFYGNATSKRQAEMAHEIMHAIALPHFFIEKKDVVGDKKHTFERTRTPNYMDYNNAQNRTMYWQWEALYNSKYSK